MKHFLILTFTIISNFVFSADSTEYYLSNHPWVCININEADNLFAADTLEFKEGSWTFNRNSAEFNNADKSLSLFGVTKDSAHVASGPFYYWAIAKNELNKKTNILTIANFETKTFHEYFIVVIDKRKLILARKK